MIESAQTRRVPQRSGSEGRRSDVSPAARSPLERDSAAAVGCEQDPELEWICCPVCGSPQSALAYERSDLRHRVDDRRFRVVRCLDCGTGYVNPRPNAALIHRYYPAEFYGAEDSPEAAIASQRERLDAMAAWLGHLAPGRLLDVGCYKGEFIYWMSQRGWSVQGVEFSGKPPNRWNQPIHYGDVADLPLEPKFDAITLWAVLEHVFDPWRTIGECAARLRPGGRMFILVPNFRSVPARFLQHDDVPRHLTMFTESSLRRLVQGCGLAPLRCVCEQSVYSGSVRGVFNYVVKLLAGEKLDEIVAQNRASDRWTEFATHLRGRSSDFMTKVDLFDQRQTPRLNRWLDRLGLGFIMTMEAERI